LDVKDEVNLTEKKKYFKNLSHFSHYLCPASISVNLMPIKPSFEAVWS